MEQEIYIFVTHNNYGKGIDLSHSINLFCLSYIISNNSNEFDFLDQFGIMKLNDKSGKYYFKVYCVQSRNVAKAKHSILKAHPNAELFLEIKPNANAKNFLHKLKELYGRGKDAKLSVSYNFVNLVGTITEDELRDMVDGVVEHAKNFGNE